MLTKQANIRLYLEKPLKFGNPLCERNILANTSRFLCEKLGPFQVIRTLYANNKKSANGLALKQSFPIVEPGADLE